MRIPSAKEVLDFRQWLFLNIEEPLADKEINAQEVMRRFDTLFASLCDFASSEQQREGHMKTYREVIAYVSESILLPLRNEEINDHEVISLLAFLYGKDKLRIQKDVQTYLKKRG